MWKSSSKRYKNPIRWPELICILASGACVEILKEQPLERPKYIGIGGAVLATAVLATITGGYAFSFIVPPSFSVSIPDKTISILPCLAVIWGLIIFNLDRYIVSTIEPIDFSGFAQKSTSDIARQWVPVCIRFIFAIVIAMIISEPIKLLLFQKEIKQILKMEKIQYEHAINSQKEKNKTKEIELYNTQIERKQNPTKEGISMIQTAINDLKESISNLNITNNNLKAEALKIETYLLSNLKFKDKLELESKFESKIRELEKTRDTLTNEEMRIKERERIDNIRIQNTKYNTLKINIGKNQAEIEKLNDRIRELRLQISKIPTIPSSDTENNLKDSNQETKTTGLKKDSNIGKSLNISNQETKTTGSENEPDKEDISFGILAQIKAYKSLKEGKNIANENMDTAVKEKEKMEQKDVFFWVDLLITILFILLETTPLIFKVLAKKGIYDETAEIFNLLNKEMIKNEIEKDKEIADNYLKLKVASDIDCIKEAFAKVKPAKSEALEKLIQEWKASDDPKNAVLYNNIHVLLFEAEDVLEYKPLTKKGQPLQQAIILSKSQWIKCGISGGVVFILWIVFNLVALKSGVSIKPFSFDQVFIIALLFGACAFGIQYVNYSTNNFIGKELKQRLSAGLADLCTAAVFMGLAFIFSGGVGEKSVSDIVREYPAFLACTLAGMAGKFAGDKAKV